MFSKLSKILDRLHDEFKIPGNDLTVFHNGECVFREQRGYSDYECKRKMTGTERFNLYSTSKIITCVSAMTLWERGEFKLEDPLYLYMPEFRDMTVKTDDGVRKAIEPIRIKHLFTMSAGFDYNTSSEQIKKAQAKTDGVCGTRELMQYLAERPLSFEPGEKWQYSLCHDVLAALVECVGGIRFGEYVKKNVFAPAEMNNTTYLLDDELLPTLMAQYKYDSQSGEYLNVGTSIQSFKLGSSYESGGAGGVSCAEDYMKFLEALRLGKIIAPSTLDYMSEDLLTDAQKESFHAAVPTVPEYEYGLGFFARHECGEKRAFAGTGAGGCAYYVNPNLNYSMFYAQHVLASLTGTAWKQMKDALNEIFG